jgi:phenylalanine-4-hydroxylase
MVKYSNYVARQPDFDNQIHYSDEENSRWQFLFERQLPLLEEYAAPAYLAALERLQLPRDHIPQCEEISSLLQDATGWSIVPVPALIDFSTFFDLLSRRQFPAASFIRSQHELDYLQEPDIFHEILGHVPLLSDESYAEFVQAYGLAGCRASDEEKAWFARLFWFTVEFGLLRTENSLKAFGAGIVSSKSELPYSIDCENVERLAFEIIDILRTPYRIDKMQRVYFVLESLEQLFEIASRDLIVLIKKARSMGLKPATFEIRAVGQDGCRKHETK